MEAKELEIRRGLWATHPCLGKYCDDGELQCGTFLPPIDFLRDDWLALAEKIAKHSSEQVIEARQEGSREVVEWVEHKGFNRDPTWLMISWREWEVQLQEWGFDE